MAERLSLNEVSRLLKMSPADLRAKCEAGEIAGAERAGGHWFFPPNTVKDVAQQLGVPLLDDLPAGDDAAFPEDVSRMEISTANLDGGIPDPFSDASRPRSEPRSGDADVLFGELETGETGSQQGDMRTVMGSAAELAARLEDEIRLEVPKEAPSEDTAVLAGELETEEAGDMRTVMGSAGLFQTDEKIGLNDQSADIRSTPAFAVPSDDDAAVLSGELDPGSRQGDMRTVMGDAAQLGFGRAAEQVRLDAQEPEAIGDDDAAVLSGELDPGSRQGDMRTVMGGAGQFGLGASSEPIDLSARSDEPSGDHEALTLEEADDSAPETGGMHTMVGDVNQFGFNADEVRLDLAARDEAPSGGSSIAGDKPAPALEDSDDVVPSGGMHTVVGDASQFGFNPGQVRLDTGRGAETPSDDFSAAVLSGDLETGDAGEMGTVMGSAAELGAEQSGEVRLDSVGQEGGSSIDDASAAVLSGDLDAGSKQGDMRTLMGDAGLLGAGRKISLGSGDDDEPSAIGETFDEPTAGETGGMRTMVGDANEIGFNADQVRLDLSARNEPDGSSVTEAFFPSDAVDDADESAPTGGGMHTVVGDAAQFGFDAGQVRLDLAGREDTPISGGSSVSGESPVNLGGPAVDDSAAVLSGDLDVDDSGDMRTIMGGPGQFEPGSEDRVNLSAAGDDSAAVLSGDLDAADSTDDMRTVMGSTADLGRDEDVRVAAPLAGESDAMVLSGNLDLSDSSGNMRTEVSGDYGPPTGSDETVRVAGEDRADASDRILIGAEDLGDSSDYEPASPTILGISPLDSGSGDAVALGAMDVIDSDIRMNAAGGPRPEESDVRLVPDQANIDSDIRVSQMEDAGDSGGVWPAVARGPSGPSDSQTFAGEDATPTLPEASQDNIETTPGIAAPSPIPEESDLSINMETPEGAEELPTTSLAPPSPVPVMYIPAPDDTAELDPRSLQEEDTGPAQSDVTPAPFYMDDVTLAEHSIAEEPAAPAALPEPEYPDEELTIAEGIDMKPSPDKTSLSMNPGAANRKPGPGDSDLTLAAGDEDIQLTGSDVTNEPLARGVNTSVVNLEQESNEDFVLGGEGGSDITLNPSASGIGIGGSSVNSGLGLAGSGVDLEAPVELGPSSSGLTLGGEGDQEFLLQPAAGGSGVDQDDSDSGSQVIALDASSEDIGAYTATPTMLGGEADAFGGAPMLGGDPYAAGAAALPGDQYQAGGLPDPMMAGAAAGYGAPGYGAAAPGLAPQVVIVPRVELEYSPLQIVSLVLVTLVMVLAALMMFDLTVFNGAEWKGVQMTGSIIKPIVDLVGY